ncbi:MAG TPA: cell division protein FtsA [Candidatus Methylomirabilis sp.]|nr:cell division protein FtsA [Candidatus Methylomirabilis sp.]
MAQKLIIGLDLGSSRIRIAMGQVAPVQERGLGLSVVGAVEMPSHGISKGIVSALEDAVAALSGALEAGERQIGVPIEEAIVGIGGAHVTVMDAKGVVGVSRADGEIRPEDVERVLEAAKGAANPANHEILHVLSHGFTVDGQTGIKDPIGMHGIRLETNAHLVLGQAGNVRNITKTVFRTGLDITELVFGPLAAGEVVTTTRERELGVCVANIGASTTSLAIFEEGELLHAVVLPIGAEHITSDIAIGLRTSLTVAESIKLQHGNAIPDAIGKREEIDLAEYGAEQSELVPLRYIAEIVEARSEEIFEKVEEELRKIDRSGLLPAGVMLTGGGSKLPGLVDVAKRTLRLPASVAAATHLATPMPEYVHDPSFSTAVGLVQWGFEEMRRGSERGGKGPRIPGGANLGKFGGVLKKVFKSFIP